MYPVLFKIGPLTIYSLGLLWALGALAAAWILHLELKRNRYNPELASTMVVTAAIGGLLGARLLFVLEEWNDFLRSPWDLIFSGAGFSWYGGLIGGTIAVTWLVRRNGIPWLKAADISAPALALGYGVGRIGCFLAGDATWGKVSGVPWTMAFPDAVAGWVNPLTGVPYPPGVRVHPTQLYELVQSLFVFSILWILRERRYPHGTIFWLYLVLAGSMRFIVEFWRANPILGLGMTEYQWISLTLVLLGVYLLYRQKIWRAELAA
ncbi:MAG TPA: prolipoprotein diacylglyceryl transferase [Candidatus Binatia bacterium]|nr:prolipoprotein diacylglyceryl transferase [Candidatus Binatia bacterium]